MQIYKCQALRHPNIVHAINSFRISHVMLIINCVCINPNLHDHICNVNTFNA